MANGNENSQQRIVINFIDPLFSVVLGTSFAQIYTESWFINFHLIWQREELFRVATLILLGYITVILSWVGYHKSIYQHPIKVETSEGRWRFGLDILLLIIYFILLVSYVNFRRELWIIVSIYLLFVIWDRKKRAEVGAAADALKKDELQERRGVTVFWFLFYVLLATFYSLRPPAPNGRYYCEDWVVLIAAFAGSMLYRIHKDHRSPKWLLQLLGRPR